MAATANPAAHTNANRNPSARCGVDEFAVASIAT
ncbi:MAG: hypothetical protein QOD85_2186, partial [Gaiellaceae bacterium]|nr:hypothetical protein [Gaiellaceae bacterium]